MLTAALHERTCKQCGNPFMQQRPLQYVCGPVCAGRYVKASKKTEAAQHRARKQAAQRLPDLMAKAQTAFNAFIRERDLGQPCICCGKPFEPQKPGGSMDAGHYLARSTAPQHRFNENNVFGQRKNCNRPGGTTRAAFRAGVIARIGLAAVEELEADTTVRKWDRQELIDLAKTYRAKARELRKQREST